MEKKEKLQKRTYGDMRRGRRDKLRKEKINEKKERKRKKEKRKKR